MSAGAASDSGDVSRPDDSEDDPFIGTTIDGRYELTGFVGRGGMGTVYRAEHVTMRKAFAVKLLSPRTTDPRERARFDREAFATGRATHPNCVMASDCGTLEDGTRYLAMELLDGDTLAERLDRDTRLSVETTLHIAKHILRGVGHAHELGVVHRDLKPRNIMLVSHLDDDDFAKVLDFGLAKLVGDAREEEGGGDLTETGITFGTPAYMSPEQASGMKIDARADLYSVGVLMYEMLTGRPPFCGDDPQATLMLHVQGALPSMDEACPAAKVPESVERVVRRALDKHRDQRFADAAAFITAIEACEQLLRGPDEVSSASGPTIPASTPAQRAAPVAPRSGWSSPATWPRNTKLAVAAAALVLLVAVLAIVAATGDDESLPADDGKNSEQTAEHDRHVALPELDKASSLFQSGRKHRAAELLNTLRKQHPANARVPLAQGAMYIRWPWPVKAMESYRAAVRLDPRLKSDPTVLRHTIQTLISPSANKHAMRLLVEDLDTAAVPALRDAAANHKSPVIRRRAAEALKRIDEIR